MEWRPQRTSKFFCDLKPETLHADMPGKPLAGVLFQFKAQFKGQKEIAFDQIRQSPPEVRPLQQCIDIGLFAFKVILHASKPRVNFKIAGSLPIHFDFDAIKQCVDHVDV